MTRRTSPLVAVMLVLGFGAEAASAQPTAVQPVSGTAWAEAVRASLASQAVPLVPTEPVVTQVAAATQEHPVTAWAHAVEMRLRDHAHRVAEAGRSALAWSERGMASWYGRDHAGRRTSSGDRFDPMQLTCAHPTLPLGTKVLVTSESTGRSVVVTVNDRGPFGGRIVDLSREAASRIGMLGSGTASVTLSQATPDAIEVAQADDSDTSNQAIAAAGQDADGSAVNPRPHGQRHRHRADQ